MDLRVSVVTVQQRAAEKLRAALFAGIFQPGDRLIEADLCSRLGVSRSSLREALRTLEAEHLVTIVPNKGPSVSTVEWHDADDIYRVRALLEGEAAAQFAKRATAKEIRRMNAALRAFREADKMGNVVGRLSSTSDFYDVIMQGCGNRIIESVLQRLVARITFLRAKSMSQAGRAKYSAQEMKQILKAIESRDASGARSAASKHIENARRAARAAYQSMNLKEPGSPHAGKRGKPMRQKT